MIPAIIFGYSRKDELLSVIKCCVDNLVTPIYVNLDFPATKAIEEIQTHIISEIEHLVDRNPGLDIRLRRSKRNLGAANSIISGIDWLFSEQETGLILEDDLVFSVDFFRFMKDQIHVFENMIDAWIISGSNFLSTRDSISPILVNYPVTWGWTTTRFKWVSMRREMLKRPGLTSIRLFSKRNYWWVGSRRAHDGYVDAWDLPLAWAMKINAKYSIVPPVNLVSNIGFSNSASNTVGLKFPLNLPVFRLPKFGSSESSLVIDKNHEKFLEKHVYEIKVARRISYVLTVFDFLRFSKKKYPSLEIRVKNTTKADFDFLNLNNGL